jgi:GNAT superfamily N-acetyltransferase
VRQSPVCHGRGAETQSRPSSAPRMQVTMAVERDIPAWLALATEVEPLFGPLVHDERFRRALRRNIARGSAICMRAGDGAPGSALMGGLLLSAHPPRYQIGWLAVARAWRRQGVGRLLVQQALWRVRPPAEVSVVTFGPGVPGGDAARGFYAQLGFVPSEPAGAGPDGQPRQVYRRWIR